MIKVLILTLILALSTTLIAQDSLYTNFNFSAFENHSTYIQAGGDLNGDGYDDLIITSYSGGETNIYFGGADFDTIPDITTSTTSGGYNFLGAAYNGDINGDGFDDLVLSDPMYPTPFYNEYGIVYIFLGSTDFDLVPDIILEGYNYTHGHSSSDFRFGGVDISGDFNNDGINDLAVIHPGYPGDGLGYIHIFNGSYDFDIIEDTFIEGSVGGEALGTFHSIGDVNGDGYDDLACTLLLDPLNVPDAGIKIFPGGPGGLSEVEASIFPTPEPFHPSTVAKIDITGDFNGDGCNDIIVVTDYYGGWFLIGYGNNNYEFENYQLWEFDNGTQIVVLNINNDDFDDLFIKVYETKRIDIYSGNENGLTQVPTFSRNEDQYVSFGYTYYNCGIIKNNNTESVLIRVKLNESTDSFLTLLSLEDLQTSIDNDYELATKNYELKQNYPNPFNPTTKIYYTSTLLSDHQGAKIVVRNLAGQKIWSKNITLNSNSVTFDGSTFSSGIYYYSLIVDNKIASTKSMILIK